MQNYKNEFTNADGSINYDHAIEAGRVERSKAVHAFLRRCSEALGALVRGRRDQPGACLASRAARSRAKSSPA
jgi:hypothetical protein